MRRWVVYEKGVETIRRTPNMYVCRYWLSNGQLLSVWFKRKRERDTSSGLRYVWIVSVHIGDGRKQANRWKNGPVGRNPSTGRCGLEGLKVAMSYVRGFASSHEIGRYSALQVWWADEKRRKAYQYLKRFEGWAVYSEGGKDVFLEYRDPAFWVWKPKEDQENGGGNEEVATGN